VVSYIVVATLLLLEGGLRVLRYAEHHILDPIYEPFEATEDIPYVHKMCTNRIWLMPGDAASLSSYGCYPALFTV
jgi:hypothetical protein